EVEIDVNILISIIFGHQQHLYSTSMEFCNINRIFRAYSSSKIITIATAMQRIFSSISLKIY
ncbi:MAG: hypothetical protein PHE56_04785, partial [Bacteroidales bacterium]|nr:hypothetical protein [Bacteroidales bacterium]